MEKANDFDLDRVLAVDPGPTESACLVFDFQTEELPEAEILSNDDALTRMSQWSEDCDHLAIEMVACYGMPVGRSVFETALHIGAFMSLWDQNWDRCTKIYRHDEKITICKNARAKDSNIRQALIDRYGGKEKGVGGKKCSKCKGKGWFGRGRPTCPKCDGEKWETPPGPLYGISKDLWAALAVAVTFKENLLEGRIDLDTFDHRS